MFKDRDGWRVQWREAGRRRSKSFADKAEARKFELELELGIAGKQISDVEMPTFAEFAEIWLERICKTEKCETRWKKDRCIIHKHIIPEIGSLKLTALRKEHFVHLKGKIASKRADGKNANINKSTVNAILGFAKQIMSSAVELGYLKSNPFVGVKKFKVAESDFTYWTLEELDRFVEVYGKTKPEFTRLVVVACHTGLRCGELAALERRDLDFDRRCIKVKGSWSSVLNKVFPTKGKEVSQIPMNSIVMKALEPKRFLTSPDAVIFNRSLLRNPSARLKRLSRKAGVAPIRFHDLRHTFASCLAMSGVDLLTIQKLLRHKSYQMTLRYAHLRPEHLEGVTEVLCASGTQKARKNECVKI